MELAYYKITSEDYEMARDHFRNEKQLGEFIVALFHYYKTDEYPKISSVKVEKYFRVYFKTAKFIQQQRKKKLGKKADKPIENQTNTENWLATNTQTETKPTDKPKVKISKEKIKKDKENNISEFDKQIRTRCRTLFLDVYRTNNHTEYYWTPKDATNMNQLIQKVRVKVIEKFGELNESDLSERIYQSMNILLTKQTDTWILNNLSYPTLNSKFNDIYSQLKNSQNGTSNSNPEHAKIFNAIKHLIK